MARPSMWRKTYVKEATYIIELYHSSLLLCCCPNNFMMYFFACLHIQARTSLDPEVDALISFIFLHQGSLAREAAEAVTEDTMSKTLHD